MPDLSVVPRAERVTEMAAWLQRNGVAYDDAAGDEGVRSAWNKVKASMRKASWQQREHMARGDAATPLRSSIQRAEQRKDGERPARTAQAQRGQKRTVSGEPLISLDELLQYATCAGLRCSMPCAARTFALLAIMGGRRNRPLAADHNLGGASAVLGAVSNVHVPSCVCPVSLLRRCPVPWEEPLALPWPRASCTSACHLGPHLQHPCSDHYSSNCQGAVCAQGSSPLRSAVHTKGGWGWHCNLAPGCNPCFLAP